MPEDKENPKPKTNQKVILLVAKIVFLIIFIVIIFFVIFGATRMKDYNMYPSIKNGDLLIYYRLENNFNNGDLVVVDRGEGKQVYRIIASPGQSIDIDEDNNLSINGEPPTYEAFYETPRANKALFDYPYKVSPNCYFMLNDYRSNTNDSRAFGEICRDKIKGRLITKIQIRDF